MTRNELTQRIDDLNQQFAEELSIINKNNVAYEDDNITDDQAEQVDNLLANIFKRGGY